MLRQNRYPAMFIHTSSSPSPQSTIATQKTESEDTSSSPLVMIPYVAGVSDDIRCFCRTFDMKVIFKFRWTFCFMLTKVKDALPLK